MDAGVDVADARTGCAAVLMKDIFNAEMHSSFVDLFAAGPMDVVTFSFHCCSVSDA